MVSPPRRLAGFTLVELLVALAVFAVLSGIVYSALGVALDASRETAVRNERRAEIMHAVTIMERDMLQMSRRRVWNEFGQLSPALLVARPPGARMEFTRAGLLNPRREKRPSLQRVAYSIVDDDLVREVWPVLDRTPQSAPVQEILLEDVEDLVFGALSTEWASSWPSVPAATRESAALPRAVRFVLSTSASGAIERIVPVAGG